MTDNGNANTIGDLIRSLFGFLNRGVYFLLGIMYQIFFNVASAQLFESETIKNFYGRIQLIIGVFMVFKLAVSILQGIMSPDQFSDPKSGFGNFITRVVVALALLTVLVPINVPDVENANSFEKYINNNGLLFGTLYSLQERILSNNTLGRLILGTTDEATSTSSSDDSGMSEADRQTAMLERSSRIFASTILKGFLRINLLPVEIRESDSETDSQNWYCGANLSGTASEALKAYMQLDIDPSTLLSDEVLHADCEINDNILTSLANGASNIPIIGALFENFGGNSRYVFWFDGFFALIVGIVFLVILVGFTVDIAIRSIKLAILRLIAPIPVISYIEPKSSKDGGMFSSWVKALTSTYLDLFLRLAIVYFVIFLIQDMIVNGFVINEAGGMVGIISFIFIMLGLFFFAKMAPKFIKDALGLKGAGMSNVGLSGILGTVGAAAGTLASGGGVAKALTNGLEAGYNSSKANLERAMSGGGGGGKNPPSPFSSYRDKTLQQITGDKNRRGGLLGTLDHWSDNKMAERYGLSGNNIAKQKGIVADEENKLNQLNFDYENERANNNALRNSSQALLEKLSSSASSQELSRYVNPDGSWKSNTAKQIAYKKSQAAASQHDSLLSSKSSLDRQLQTSDAHLAALYSAKTDQARVVQDAQDYLKDMKDTRGTMVAKDPKFTAKRPAAPGSNNAQPSSQGSPGAGFGVNGPGPGGPPPVP